MINMDDRGKKESQVSSRVWTASSAPRTMQDVLLRSGTEQKKEVAGFYHKAKGVVELHDQKTNICGLPSHLFHAKSIASI